MRWIDMRHGVTATVLLALTLVLLLSCGDQSADAQSTPEGESEKVGNGHLGVLEFGPVHSVSIPGEFTFDPDWSSVADGTIGVDRIHVRARARLWREAGEEPRATMWIAFGYHVGTAGEFNQNWIGDYFDVEERYVSAESAGQLLEHVRALDGATFSQPREIITDRRVEVDWENGFMQLRRHPGELLFRAYYRYRAYETGDMTRMYTGNLFVPIKDTKPLQELLETIEADIKAMKSGKSSIKCRGVK